MINLYHIKNHILESSSRADQIQFSLGKYNSLGFVWWGMPLQNGHFIGHN